MTKKQINDLRERFELFINHRDQYDIRDNQKDEKNVIHIYNDLGVPYFSSAPALCEKLNNLHEKNKKTKDVLQKYFNQYTKMAIELRTDKYGNSVCHDVVEVILEIATELDMELEEP